VKDVYNASVLLRRRFSDAFSTCLNGIPSHIATGDSVLRDLASTDNEPAVDRVLLDGMWYNPNHFWRISLLRRALGLANGSEFGVVGEHNTEASSATFRRLGICEIDRFHDGFRRGVRQARKQARKLLKQTSRPSDIFDWDLPHGFPGTWVYDGILKRRRLATVDLTDPNLEDYVAEALLSLESSERILERRKPQLVALSHLSEFSYGSLGFVASSMGIPSIVLYGCYGVPRFWKVRVPDGIFDWVDRIQAEEIDRLDPDKRAALRNAGKAYLNDRVSGRTVDLGTQYAFINSDNAVNRESIRSYFGWDNDKPIIGVYASNWFDYPHVFGLQSFEDYLDWIQTTASVARDVKDVNWLFKPHPCDQWYGGVSLPEYVSEYLAPHIGLAPQGWNGQAVMNSIDGVITCTGTASLEYASLGKPSLIAERGWCHDSGAGLWCKNRDEYTSALRRSWWKDIDTEKAREYAETFSGWFFCHPTRQDGLLVGDDSHMLELYREYPGIVSNNPAALDWEIGMIRDWYMNSDEMHLHSYKMRRSELFKH